MDVREVAWMGCIIKYAVCMLIAISIGVAAALLFPLSLIAGVEAVLIVLLCLLISCKK